MVRWYEWWVVRVVGSTTSDWHQKLHTYTSLNTYTSNGPHYIYSDFSLLSALAFLSSSFADLALSKANLVI